MIPAHTVVASLVLLAACSSDPAVVASTEAPNPPVAAPMSVADTLDLPPVNEAALADNLDDDGAAAALAYDRAFRDVNTGDDLKAAYEQALRLVPSGDNTDMDRAIAFAGADLGLAGLLSSCVAECSEASYDLDIPTWQRAAQRVGDESAVAYFDLLERLYDFPEREEDPETWADFPVAVGVYDGSLLGWPNYRTQTWDYGGYSNVGSGLHAALLNDFVAMNGLEGAFEDEIRDAQEEVALDLVESTCIGPSAEDAMSEVARVNDSMVMPAVAQTTYDGRMAALENPADSGIQTECAALDSNCTCVGG